MFCFKKKKLKKMDYKFKSGDEVVVTLCTSLPNGSNLPMPYSHNKAYWVSSVKGATHIGYIYEFEISSCLMKKDEIEAEITRKEEEIKDLKEKLDFINSSGGDTFNEDEYKAQQVLKLMGFDDIKKAKELIRILKCQ